MQARCAPSGSRWTARPSSCASRALVLYAIADFVARHAIAVLSVITIAMLALSAAAWHVLANVAPRMWPLGVDLWNRARHTRPARWLRELPMLGRALSTTLTIARYLG